MKIVLDTNILVSAIVFRGKPKRLIEEAIENGIVLYISPFIENELNRVLKEKFSFDKERLTEVRCFIKDNFIKTRPKNLPKVIKRDISDNNILALAEEVQSDYIISGDNDLVELGSYEEIPIKTPDQFIEIKD